jgi:hypothetical protein
MFRNRDLFKYHWQACVLDALIDQTCTSKVQAAEWLIFARLNTLHGDDEHQALCEAMEILRVVWQRSALLPQG